MTWRLPVGFALGTAAGVALTLWLGPGGPAGAPAPEAPARVEPAAPLVVPGPAADEPERALRACHAEVAALRAVLDGSAALPPSWPSDLPPAATADDVRAWVGAAMEDLALPATLRELECSEYPCIALLALDEGVPADSRVVEPLRQRYLERAGADGAADLHMLGTGTRNFAVVAFQAAGDPPAGREPRTAQRIQDLFDAYAP
ncbi:MAG: hypothetical protein R3F59_33935 [Myxococcota bacterium]